MINSDKYINMLTDDNVNRISANLINEIQKHFNIDAPIIKVKIENDERLKFSKDTKNILKKKNDSYIKMKQDNSSDNVKEFKVLSKICRKRIAENRRNILKN